ncbi:MAG: 30S ribosomal protein S17 [Epsilonproteobacteria bacterium]|nr:30S ribosomal protein S17 [Campylobacterota bacterium]
MNDNKTRLKGVVVSDKMDKSVVVLVKRRIKDKRTQKVINQKKRYVAHDVGNQYKEGNEVIIREMRPLSKKKHFVVEGLVQENVQ